MDPWSFTLHLRSSTTLNRLDVTSLNSLPVVLMRGQPVRALRCAQSKLGFNFTMSTPLRSSSSSPTAFVSALSVSTLQSHGIRNTRFLCSSKSSSRVAATSFLQTEEERIADHAVYWGGSSGSDNGRVNQKVHKQSHSTVLMVQKPSSSAQLVDDNDTSARPMAKKLDGKVTAAAIRAEIRERVNIQVATYGEKGRPGLAVVIVGTRPDSMTYVRSKRKACDEAGIFSYGVELSEEVTQGEVERIVDELNGRSDIDGILVQLPLPKHLYEEQILNRISIEKDVDGFHPLNIGRLCMTGRVPPLFIPCTPRACVELLDRYGIDVDGKQAVVIGRSNIVGLPVAMLLMHRNATVSICHSKTADIESYVREADIVVAACGRPLFVKSEWLKQDAVVLDVGINAVDDATKKKGYRLVGDVDYEGALTKAAWITPVPGGIGPMTIAMLLQNTVDASARRVEL